MFTIIADATNDYAHKKIRSLLEDRDAFQQLEHHSHRRHARLSTWKDMNAADIKIFIAHLCIMCLVKKPALHNYWSTTSLPAHLSSDSISVETTFKIFFGTCMCATLWTTQLLDSQIMTHWQKVCPFIVMCQDNFKLRYTPNKNLTVDESCVPFKGQVKFLQYNKVSIILQITFMPILIT